MKDKTNIPLLGFVKVTGYPVALFYMRAKKYYINQKKKDLPKKCIVMSNHTSLLDFPMYLGTFYTKTIHWLMSEALFKKSRLFSWFLLSLGGIYVDRTQHNFDFVRDALKILDKGGKVGVFPQGRIPVGGRKFPYMPGITVLALQTDAPIIPLYTDGNYGFFKTVHVMIGEEIHIRDYTDQERPDGAEIKRLTKILEEKSYELRDELLKRLTKK